MSKIPNLLRRTGISIAVFVLVCVPPGAAFADAGTNGIDKPGGAAGHTYSYNQDSGLWENTYYTWNVTTKETLPKQPLEYTYNPVTGLWDVMVWEFHPNVDAYEQVTVSVGRPPAGAVTHGGPTPVSLAPDPSPVPAAAPASSDAASTAVLDTPANGQSATQVVAPELAQGGTTVTVDTGGGVSINDHSSITLANTIASNAQSGNALLQGNFTGGDAASGNAAAIATIINMLQSSAGLDGSGLATFVKDIQGDVSGDILIDPAAYAQPSSSVSMLGDVDINISQDSTIHNDIDLMARSGNATIDDNTHAGSATTGNADAVANVLNLINSVIAANQSFVGVVNIYGNYAGNILVPTDSLNALLASNGANTSAVASQSAAANLNTDSTQSITNNIDLAAVSGTAVQDDNTRTGNATTGNALTKLTVLNLTGRQVNAANSLLVFVNVLGTWVGVIMDAPAGATSAALTGGATPVSEAAQLASSSDSETDSETNLTARQNSTIVNDISAHATSGNAAVTRNFESGNATSGNATASANVVNILNSSINLSQWFGILFINVFGSWLGNFGVAKPSPAPATAAPGTDSIPSAVFSFVAGGDGGSPAGLASVNRSQFTSDADFDDFTEKVGEVLAANDIVPFSTQKQPADGAANDAGYSLALLPLALGLTGLAAIGAERIRAIRRKLAY